MNRLSSELRWHLKKAARRACLAGSSLLTTPATGIRVLTYHRFARARHDPFAVDPAEFARQMEWIAANHLGTSLDDVLDSVQRGRSIDGVLVTIDDGFASTYEVALPVLAKYQIPAIAFLPAGLIEQSAAGDPEPRLTWRQVEELATGGIEIGSHGWSHRSFGKLDAEQMQVEAILSRVTLEQRSGRDVRAFAYPFGTRADYNRDSSRAMEVAGYQCAFTSQHGPIASSADRFELPRVKIEGGEGLEQFATSCRGGLDAWRYVDLCLSGLQQRQ